MGLPSAIGEVSTRSELGAVGSDEKGDGVLAPLSFKDRRLRFEMTATATHSVLDESVGVGADDNDSTLVVMNIGRDEARSEHWVVCLDGGEDDDGCAADGVVAG